MAVVASARRTAMVAAGVGVAAGTMGTWFEMSHGVICIPVLTLPPLNLTQQVAAGTTIVGVAARETLSTVLYALDPNVDLSNKDQIDELVDVNVLFGVSSAGTAAALGAASASASFSPKFMKRASGVFCLSLALFLQWRDMQVKDAREKVEKASVRDQSELNENASATAEMMAPRSSQLQAAWQTNVPLSQDWPRLAVLGAASGCVLGFFGIGTAWMLAPLLRHTTPGRASSAEEPDKVLVEPFAVDARTRRTACLSMLLPSVASAWRHFQMGHVPQMGIIAVPLAIGAIGGSILGGVFLSDVPPGDEEKTALAGLLFAFGIWAIFKP